MMYTLIGKDYNFLTETQNNYVSYTLYQPNVYPQDSYDSNKHLRLMEKYNNILIKNKSSDLIIFPETIISAPYDENNQLYKYFQSLTSKKIC